MYNGPVRKRTRLQGFDYSSENGYFITFCTKNRINYFGEIKNGEMILNEFGKIAEQEILNTEKLRKNIKIDEFVIMPNHIHLILFIVGNDCIVPDNHNPVGNDCIVPDNNTIVPYNQQGPMQLVPTVMKGLKSTITKQINTIQNHCRERLHRSELHRSELHRSELHRSELHRSELHRSEGLYDYELFSWQKSYHDRIIRNENELNRIRQYIIDNPKKWKDDEFNK